MLYSRFKFKCSFLFRFFLHGGSSSFDNHWQYQQHYHKLLDQKSSSLICCIKACMHLNGTEWLVEMNWKNVEKDWKPFGTVLKIQQKNAVFLETLQAAIIFQRFPCILRKLIVQEKSFADFFRNMRFLFDAIDLKQSVKGTIEVLGKFLKTVLDKVHFIDKLYSFHLPPVCQENSSFPKISHLPASHVEQLLKLLPPLDTSTIALVCTFS